MPSQICHVLAGISSRKHAGFAPDPQHIPLFNLGCQGPDIFAHNRRTKPFALAYARLLHRRRYGAFCRAAAVSLRNSPDPQIRAWLAGFVTHQAVDRMMHPYIVYRSAELPAKTVPGVSPALYHAFFERIIDVLILRRQTGRQAASFNTDPVFRLSRDACAILSRFIAATLRSVYPESAADDPLLEQRVTNAFWDTRYFYHLTNPARTGMSIPANKSAITHFSDRGPAGVALLYSENPDAAVDWLNDSRSPWKDPVGGTPRHESAGDLFDRAVGEGAAVIRCLEAVLSGDESPEALEQLAGNSCLSIQNADGSIAAVSYADPLDLPAELVRETALRERWISGLSVDPVKGELV